MTETMTYSISEVPAGRIGEVSAFVKQIMEQLYPKGQYHTNPRDLAQFDEVYIEAPDACFYMAEAGDGRVIGTVAIRPYDHRFPALGEHLSHSRVCEVTRLYMDEGHRRMGIGSRLYAEAEAFAARSGYQGCYLHTSSYLPGGYPFWTSRSYQELQWESDQIVHMVKWI